MRKIKPLCTILFGLLIFVSCRNDNKDLIKSVSKSSSELSAKLDSIGYSFLDKGDIMGFTISVAQNGNIIYNKGFGYSDQDRKNLVDSNTIFLNASVSKLIGSAIVMKLVEEGKISLDEKIAKLLPDFPNQGQAEKIKLRHLLSHTSGLKDYAIEIDSTFLATGIAPTKEDYYSYFAKNELDFEPGSNFNYSNSGFLLMALIIEQLTGKPFTSEIDRVINEPHNLNFRLVSEAHKNQNFSDYFEWGDSTLVKTPVWTWIKGDGGITSTSNDLAKFAYLWANGKIISTESFNEMTTSYILTDGISTDYALGVRLGKFENISVMGHTGGHKSVHAIMKHFPEKNLSTVILMNTDDTPTDALYIDGFVSLIVLKKEYPDLEKTELKGEDLSKYTGDYFSPINYYSKSSGISFVMYENDSSLYRKRLNSDSKGGKVYYLGDNSFSYKSFPMDRIKFSLDSSGNAIAFKTYYNGLRKGGLFKKRN